MNIKNNFAYRTDQYTNCKHILATMLYILNNNNYSAWSEIMNIDCKTHILHQKIFVTGGGEFNEIIDCPNKCGKKIRVRVTKAPGFQAMINNTYFVDVSEYLD